MNPDDMIAIPENVAEENCSVEEELKKLQDELLVTDKLLEERNRVLEAIPECPFHGKQCVPHAVEWIRRVRTLAEIITAE